jgi:hypothetical protein
MNEESRNASFASARVLRRGKSVSFTRFGDEGLVVVPATSYNLVLNGVAMRAFELIDGSRSLAQIAELIQQEYDTPPPAEVLEDLGKLIEHLIERQALSDETQ